MFITVRRKTLLLLHPDKINDDNLNKTELDNLKKAKENMCKGNIIQS